MLRYLACALFTLPLASAATLTVQSVTLQPENGSTIATAPTGVVIRCSATVAAATVHAGSVQLQRSGGDGTFADGNEQLIIPTALAVAGDTITADLTGLTLPNDHYRIRLSGANAGKALSFDGTGQLVVMPNNPSLNPTTALTLETWFNFAVGGNWNPRMIERDLYNIGTTGTGASRLIGVGYGLESTVTFAAGEWHHAALTINGATTDWKLYVDGNLVDTITGVALSPGSAIPLRLGRSRNAGYDQYLGVLDEVRMWNVVRSQAQIRADMTRRFTGLESGLVGLWHCDDGSGQTLADATVNGNNATMGANSTVAVDDPTWVTSTAPLGIRSTGGILLDGELAAYDRANLPSGDGTAGGDFLLEFVVAPAGGGGSGGAFDPASGSGGSSCGSGAGAAGFTIGLLALIAAPLARRRPTRR